MSDNNAAQPEDGADRDQQLEAVIADYIRACETGTAPNRSEILKRHPEFADELRQFFGQHDRMNQIAAPIRGFGDSLAQAVGPGQQLSYVGNYELLEEIARGGMGVVYKARQTTLGRIVAVKMIVSGRLASEQDVQRFHVEARAAAGLQHPNIVSIHEVGQHEGWHYFSMDYVEGRDLSKILRENLSSAKQAATYVRQMAEAIHYAHQQGILHRDLKPSNILIDSHDQVRITDFGLAMRVEGGSDLTRTGQIVGTPSYMPPEQAQGKRSLIGPGSDVYSLGAVLYECLTGRAPFRADSVFKTIEQVIHAEAASPRTLNAAIPRDLETICLKCLEKEPHRRYGTAQLLADDLQRYLDVRPILARPVGFVERTCRWCRRNPVVASLMTTVAASLIVGTSVSTYFAMDASRRADDNFLLARKESDARSQADRRKTEAEGSAELAERHRKEAFAATESAKQSESQLRDQLWQSLLDQAKYIRQSGKSGQRLKSLEALGKAARIRPALEIRNEAIASLARIDVIRKVGVESADSASPSARILSAKLGDNRSLAPSGNWIASVSNNDVMVTAETPQAEAFACNHPQPIDVILWRQDSRFLAVACFDTNVYIWRMADRKLHSVMNCQSRIYGMSFCNHGRYLLTNSYDGVTRIWDPISGECLWFSAGSGVPTSLTTDSAYFEIVGTKECRVLHHGELGNRSALSLRPPSLFDLDISNSSRYLATAGEDGTRIWDLASDEEISFLPEASGLGVVFTPTQDLIGNGPLGLLRWRYSEREQGSLLPRWVGPELLVPAGTSNIHDSIAINADGRFLVFADNGRNRASWIALSQSEQVHHLEGQRACWFVSISPDSSWITTSSWAWEPPEPIRIRSRESGEVVYESRDDSHATATFSPDGRWLATGGHKCYKILETGTWKEIARFSRTSHLPGPITFSPDGRYLALLPTDFAVQILDTKDFREVATFTPPMNKIIRRLRFSPDGRLITLMMSLDTVCVWNIDAVRAELVELNLDWNPPASHVVGAFSVQVKMEPQRPLK